MDEQKIAAEAAGAAVALGSGWKVLHWIFPRKNGTDSTMLCRLDKKIDNLTDHFMTHIEQNNQRISRLEHQQERTNEKLDRLIVIGAGLNGGNK